MRALARMFLEVYLLFLYVRSCSRCLSTYVYLSVFTKTQHKRIGVLFEPRHVGGGLRTVPVGTTSTWSKKIGNTDQSRFNTTVKRRSTSFVCPLYRFRTKRQFLRPRAGPTVRTVIFIEGLSSRLFNRLYFTPIENCYCSLY
jgi:hypothetical protein